MLCQKKLNKKDLPIFAGYGTVITAGSRFRTYGGVFLACRCAVILYIKKQLKMRSQSDITSTLLILSIPVIPHHLHSKRHWHCDRVLWQLSSFNPFRPASDSESGVTEQFCPPAPESGTETRFIRLLVFVSKQSLYQSELRESYLYKSCLSWACHAKNQNTYWLLLMGRFRPITSWCCICFGGKIVLTVVCTFHLHLFAWHRFGHFAAILTFL